MFLSELSEVLSSVCAMLTSTLLFGDFNIHVDSPSSAFEVEFLALLDCFNQTQHVQFPTHNTGHILDLVCFYGSDPSNLCGFDLTISDHQSIFLDVEIPPIRRREKRSFI